MNEKEAKELTEILQIMKELVITLKEMLETSKRTEKLFAKYDSEYQTIVEKDGYQIE